MMRLETDDSIDKVADWYTEKLNPTEVMRQPSNVILKSGDMAVIMTPNGRGTNIMLKTGEQ